MTEFISAKSFRRALLPMVTFFGFLALHYVWLGIFSPQTRWVLLGDGGRSSWMRRYVETESYWLGLSYAISLAFAVVCLRRYREERSCGAQQLAIGGVTFSGLLALAGCYLLGCCGSPMLAVYLSLFGTAFLPLAQPIVFSLTVLWILVGWWWMNQRRAWPAARAARDCCGDAKP